jgi:hypothetical protein
MKKLILTATIAAGLGLPSIALAQTAPLAGSIVCRPAQANETANATIQNTQVLCRPVDMARIRSAMTAAMTDLTATTATPTTDALSISAKERSSATPVTLLFRSRPSIRGA